jgi:hypothetical protein
MFLQRKKQQQLIAKFEISLGINYGLTGRSTARCHVILMVKLFAPLKVIFP